MNANTLYIKARHAILLSTLCLTGNAIADDVLSLARELLQESKASEAYALLSPLESSRAGEKDFDYLLGVASLESGQPNEAIFALERAVASDPLFGGARMDLGRAFFSVNDYAQAAYQFETVLNLSPPENVVAWSRQYLQKIDNMKRRQAVDKQLSVEWITGYDDNVNNSTYHDTFTTPLVTFTLNDTARAKAAYFAAEKVAADVTYAPNRRTQWAIGGNSYFFQFKNASNFNSVSATAFTQWKYNTSERSATIAFARSQTYMGFDLNNFSTQVHGEYRHHVNSSTSVTSFAGLSRVRYPGKYALRDYNRFHIGSGVIGRINVPNPIIINAAVVASQDDTLIDTSVWKNDAYAVQFNSFFMMTNKQSISSGLQLQKSQYREEFLGIARRDYQANASLKYSAGIGKFWAFEPNANYVKNRSSVDLFDYDKFSAALAIKRVLL